MLLSMIDVLPIRLLVAVDILPILYIGLGMTFIGLFTKYKIFLLVSIGPIIFIMYDYAEIVDPHEGMPIILTSLAAWILFNVYLAFRSDNDD